MTLEERHAELIQRAIRDRRLLAVKLIDEQQPRLCIPFDYRPRGIGGRHGSFIFYEFDEAGVPGSRLEIASGRLLAIRLLDLRFRPEEFIGWPKDWHLPRNWPGTGLAGCRDLTGV